MSLDAIAHLVVAHGYGLVFVAICLDCLGLPVPGELLLISFGALAMTGHFAPSLGIVVAAAGVLTGDALTYWVCRLRSPAFLTRLGLGRALNGKTIVLGRFVIGARMALAPMAGARRHPFGRFLGFDAIGATCWATTFVLIGYIGGRDLTVVQHHLSSAMSVMQAVLIGAVASYVVTRVPRAARVAGAVATALLVIAFGPATALGAWSATRSAPSADAREAFAATGPTAGSPAPTAGAGSG